LLLVEDEHQEVPVRLERGRFKLRRSDATRGRELMIRWYAAHARVWLRKRVRLWAGRVRVSPAGITVQDLGYRWGSCGKGDRLYFHWRAILPPRMVEYIVVRELVHLHEEHERAMPDFEQRKRWLAGNAGQLGI
jgi:hypothetical protein